MKIMQTTHPIQYTIRGIQPAIDKELRRMALASGRSLNQVTLEALRVGADIPIQLEPDNSLDDLFGSMSAKEAMLLEAASKEARKIHPKEHY